MEKRARRKDNRSPFWEGLNKMLEVDADMLRSGIRIEIRGRTRVTMEGVKKILSYTEEMVALSIANGTVCVKGQRLTCVFYRRGEAAVEGKIEGIFFEE